MATASSLAENLAKELECAVCLEQYKEPKVLPCLHSFCQTCLQGLLTKQGLLWKINCPACRISVEIPQGQVDSLPVNFFINNLLSMVSLHSGRNNLECDNCDSGDPAINRCTTCCHFLCEFCSAGHKRGRSTKTHQLMSLEEAKKEGMVAVTRPSLCKEHEEEMLKLFCETCEEAICRDCTIVKHRDHKYTFVKDAFAKGKDGVMKILAETKTKASALQDSLNGISEMKRIVQIRAELLTRGITKSFNELSVSLETRHADLVSGVEELRKTKLKALEIQQGELETALASLQSSVEFTEKAFKNGSEVEILNMHKKMSSRLQELNSAKWQLEPCADDGMTFKDHKKSQLQQEIAAFGDISDVVTHASTSTVTMGHGSEGVMYNTLCGQQIQFTITAKERNGKKRTEGGDVFIVRCVGGTVHKILNVNDCGHGTYSFSYTPQQVGQWELSVLISPGHHVQGSPLTWFVEKWNLVGISSDNKKNQVTLSGGKLTATYIYTADSDSDDSSNLSDDSEPTNVHGPLQYVVGSASFSGGKHLWKTKLRGDVSENFSIGINSSRISGKKIIPGKSLVWDATSSTSASKKRKSTVTNYASKDTIEMYLDCDNGTLMMYNQRTNVKSQRSWTELWVKCLQCF